MHIEHYSFGQIVIDKLRYSEDVLIFSDKVEDFYRAGGSHILTVKDLDLVLESKPSLLIIGTGAYGVMKVLPEVEERLKQEEIEYKILPTAQAVQLYNQQEDKSKTVAALHLTC